MSKIIIGTSRGRNIGFDVPLLLAGRLLITADSGGGKSWLARVLFEQIFGKVQTIIIDPEGEFASLREKFPFVLAAKGGDTPIDVRSAGMLAHRLLKLRASAICDLYELKAEQRHIWVRDFFNALIEAPKELRVPLVVGVDEFHIFAPEKGQGESEALQASIDMATRGRKRGICLAGITQRLAMLSKNVSSQLQNRLVGPTFEEVNIKTAVRLLGIAPGKEERAFHQQIQLLEPGNFFALGRAISRDRILVKVRDIQTTHPKAFEKHSAPLPPTPDEIKALLPQLADLPKEAEDKARTEAEFRREIRDLKGKLTAAENAAKRVTAVEAKLAAPKVDPHQARKLREFESLIGEVVKIIAKINAIGFDGAEVKPEDIQAALEKAAAEVGKLAAQKLSLKRRELENLKAEVNRLLTKLNAKLGDDTLKVAVDVVKNEPVSVRPVQPISAPRAPREPRAPMNGGGEVRSRLALQIAGILAAYYPNPLKRGILAAMCGVTYGGHFSNNLSELRSAGLLEDRGAGEVVGTEKCAREYAGSFQPPTNTEEVVAIWDVKLSLLARKILRKLVDLGGESITRNDLAESLGVTYGGHFSNNLSELRGAGLIEDLGSGQVAANREALFLPNHAA